MKGKRGFGTAIVVGLLVVLLTGTTYATDLQQIVYSNGFQVQNLSSTDTDITIFYYPQGSGDPIEVHDTIPGGSSVTYATLHDEVGAPFNGSVIVTADQPVAAIVNTLGDFPQYAAATNAFSGGATAFALPLVMCNNNGFDTWFNIQNIGVYTAHVTIDYVAGFAGVDDSETATIAPKRARTFNQASGSNSANCDTLAGTDGRFVGSADITSDQPVVATAMQVNASNYPVMLGYDGFAGGSDEAMVPLVMSNNNGFYTGIQVQNVGTSTTTVTVTYSDNTVDTSRPVDDVFGLEPGEAKTLIHNDGPPANGSTANDYDMIGRYVGSAIVTNSAGVPLVAIVNQFSPNPGGDPRGTSHSGFNPVQATSRLAAPLIMSNNNSFYTGIQVQNVGSNPVTVTMTYGPNLVRVNEPQDEVFSLEPGASKTIIQNAAPPANGSTVNNWNEIGQYVGSATVTADGPIAAIVNEFTGEFPGDQFYTYNAINY